MKVFITGIAGFLGSHLHDALKAEGHDVWGCDNLSTGEIDNIKTNQWDMIDISCPLNLNPYLVEVLKGVDVVYHCAAAAYEGLSVFSPAFISNNIYTGSANVFSAAIQNNVKRIVFCSSMARYGVGTPPFDEDDEPNPIDPYGLAKLGAERLLACLAKVHNFEHVIIVPHNIYGPRQKYDDPYRNVVAIMANRMLKNQPPIIYGDGEQIRCFSYIDDVIGPLKDVATNNVVGETINVGPDEGEISINGLVEILYELIPVNEPSTYVTGRPQEVKHATCSANKARALLDYEPKTSLRDGVKELIRYIRERGPRSFNYHLDVEVVSDKTPKTWTEKQI